MLIPVNTWTGIQNREQEKIWKKYGCAAWLKLKISRKTAITIINAPKTTIYGYKGTWWPSRMARLASPQIWLQHNHYCRIYAYVYVYVCVRMWSAVPHIYLSLPCSFFACCCTTYFAVDWNILLFFFVCCANRNNLTVYFLRKDRNIKFMHYFRVKRFYRTF